ncbi:MAG: nucleotidyltransferase family protein [Methylococcales bacterium]
MRRDEVLSLLQAHRGDIQRRFAVRHLAIFGSTARNEARDDSDVDVLVDFEGPASFDGYMDLKFFLEDILQCRVDLVTNSGLKPRARPYVEKDLIHVA